MTICDPLRRTTPPDPRVHTPRLLSMILAAPGTVVGLGDTVDEELVDAVDEERGLADDRQMRRGQSRDSDPRL